MFEAFKPGAQVKRLWVAIAVTSVVGLFGLFAMQIT